MNIEKYLYKLHSESTQILTKSITKKVKFGEAHHYSCCIYEFSQNISDPSEKKILQTVSSQLETANFCASIGMYRQAFISLRLAFEMGLGVAHFSVHKLQLHEWLDGRSDINWSSLICENEGVMSSRFAKAFFNEFIDDLPTYRQRAKSIYRKLSEFVHGNNDTWTSSQIELSYDDNKLDDYFESVKTVSDILLFVLSCRYLKSFSISAIESMEFIPEEMKHIDYIREYFGGPKV